ncbi:MAG: malonyl-CoA decarboxylase [Rickettsiales bacterium]|nr:malonyl-CoA decarboxylase [Rickettsiales bacterium]
MSEPALSISNIRRKTVLSLLRTWRGIEGTARHAIQSTIRPDLPKEDMVSLRQQMELCLDSPGGEVSERSNTADLGRSYLGLNEEGRTRFLQVLASDFDVDHNAIAAIGQQLGTAQNDEERLAIEMELRQALVSPRSVILKQFTALPEGFKFLVNMRADLLPLVNKDSKLKGLEHDLKAILSAWFDVGLLDLVEVTWRSPAALLEKLIEYEAVHRVASWDDLKNRLDADRRVFAFFHSKMPLDPLIFVHVAFTEGMSDNVQVLLDQNSPLLDTQKADSAIFYSISNAQKGLAGISFGNFLIKRVVGLLTQEMPHIKTYATLSPIPGFRAWLDPLLKNTDESILQPAEIAALKKLGNSKNPTINFYEVLEQNWPEYKEIAAVLKPILMRLCARYLLEEKRNGKPLDPVSNFHLFNGARLERMNWLGDISPKGMKQSAGLMVNYYYKLSEIDENHENFATHGKIVASKQVKSYLD